MKRALKRCTEPKEYEDLLKFLQKQPHDNLQNELLREKHRLTDPAEILLKRITKLKEFSDYLKIDNAESFQKSEASVYDNVLSLLTELKIDIDSFNTQDGNINQKEFLDWRNPRNN